MLEPFEMYGDDEEILDTVFVTREIPEELEDKFHTLVDNMLLEYGYAPEEFDEEGDDAC